MATTADLITLGSDVEAVHYSTTRSYRCFGCGTELAALTLRCLCSSCESLLEAAAVAEGPVWAPTRLLEDRTTVTRRAWDSA